MLLPGPKINTSLSFKISSGDHFPSTLFAKKFVELTNL